MKHLPLSLVLLAACEQDYNIHAAPVDVDPGAVTECGFTRVGETDFYAYDCNPVFSTSGESWATSVSSATFTVTQVFGHPFYQLWYVGVPNEDEFGDFGLGYAISSEGTDWRTSGKNPMLVEPSANAWDASNMDALQVVWDPTSAQYVMVYQGYNIEDADPRNHTWGLGVATSTNGTTWTRLPTNPVLDLTVPEDDVAWCWPLGLTLGDVAGYTGYIAGYSRANGPCEVYRLGGSAIDSWSPSTKVVLSAGAPGEWDDQGVVSLAVAELEGVKHMFYAGFGDWEDHGTYRSTASHFLGHATSDGEGWSKQGRVDVNRTPEGHVTSVAANTVGKRIHLWVTDEYDGVSAVGYFLYDPHRDEQGSAE